MVFPHISGYLQTLPSPGVSHTTEPLCPKPANHSFHASKNTHPSSSVWKRKDKGQKEIQTIKTKMTNAKQLWRPRWVQHATCVKQPATLTAELIIDHHRGLQQLRVLRLMMLCCHNMTSHTSLKLQVLIRHKKSQIWAALAAGFCACLPLEIMCSRVQWCRCCIVSERPFTL